VLETVGRIAPPGEPGDLLLVEGRVFQPDGTTAAADVVVFAYQTDRDGLYASPRQPGIPWRLKGWARTDADGQFGFRTIRPGTYRNRSQPAHIHLTVESPTYGRQWAPSILFEDDPLVSSAERVKSEEAGIFGHVCGVTVEAGSRVAHVWYCIKLKENPDF
jgi:protocatechuate 3,4-dioxygenase beta subunit